MAEMVKCKLNGKWEIILPKHRALRPEWYTETGWEKKRLEHMHDEIKRQIKEGITPKVYYVGAEEGEMAALCRMWGANGLLVEPNERVLPNIKAIWEANNLLPWEALIGFMGSKATAKPDWSKATQALKNIQGEVIHDHGFKELRDPGNIPIYKIDDLNSVGFVSPTIISLDVEGSEWEVLRGAEQTLKTFKPKIYLSLHNEFMLTQYNQWAAELRKWLIDMGYKETLIDYPLHEVHLYYE